MDLLMIPGPIEVSPTVLESYSVRPPSHVSNKVIEAFARSLEMMREVWGAGEDAQGFILAGSGTHAMDMAVANLVDTGNHVVIVNTGYFSDRITEMVLRRGATVTTVRAELGHTPTLEAIEEAVSAQLTDIIIATHVDTSTGVRVDVEGICKIADEHDAFTIFDGVCATAGERFEMENWGADVYLTASQKAIGLPPGLALLVMSADAIEEREQLELPPPMSLDVRHWLPIMQAYEARRPSYFATPATNLILALETGLEEILDDEFGALTGMDARFARHEDIANKMREAWHTLGLELLPHLDCAANTLSAILYPPEIEPSLLLGHVKSQGVIIAGGLHPEIKHTYFRVGHMGYSATQLEHLQRTVEAVEHAVFELGHLPERVRAADVLEL